MVLQQPRCFNSHGASTATVLDQPCNMGDQYGRFFYGGDFFYERNFSMEGIVLWERFFYERDFSMEEILL